MLRIRNFLPLGMAALVGAATLGITAQARAGYQVILTSGLNSATINDNNVPPGTFSDANLAVNKINFFGITFAGYTIDFSGSTNTPGVAGLALQTSQTLTVTASAAATDPLRINVVADGYLPGLPNPSVLSVDNSISTTLLQGPATGSATTFINGGGAGLTTTTVSLTGPPTGQLISGSAQSPTLTTIPTATPFSINSQLVISNLGLGQSANLTFTSTASAVPAPAGLILALTGMPVLGVGAWIRRRVRAAPMAA